MSLPGVDSVARRSAKRAAVTRAPQPQKARRATTLQRVDRAPQTVGRTSSTSGTLTRSAASPVPTPTSRTGLTAPPPAPAPAPAPSPSPITLPAEGVQGEPGADGLDIDIAAIEAAIAAIEAQFGLTREQLLADESEIGRQYRQLIAQANRVREASIDAVVGNALDRGILRSGIFAKNVAKVEALGAEQVAGLAAGQAAEQAGVQTAIQTAENTAAQAKLTAAQQRGGQVLSLEELEALIAAGLA